MQNQVPDIGLTGLAFMGRNLVPGIAGHGFGETCSLRK